MEKTAPSGFLYIKSMVVSHFGFEGVTVVPIAPVSSHGLLFTLRPTNSSGHTET